MCKRKLALWRVDQIKITINRDSFPVTCLFDWIWEKNKEWCVWKKELFFPLKTKWKPFHEVEYNKGKAQDPKVIKAGKPKGLKEGFSCHRDLQNPPNQSAG